MKSAAPEACDADRRAALDVPAAEHLPAHTRDPHRTAKRLRHDGSRPAAALRLDGPPAGDN